MHSRRRPRSAASKSGLNAFSEASCRRSGAINIRVSYVMPGSVATGFSGGDESKGAEWKVSADEVADVVLNLLHHPGRSLPSRSRASTDETAEKVKRPCLLSSTNIVTRSEHHGTMMGATRGRLAVALDLLTDSLALVGQHGVYCKASVFRESREWISPWCSSGWTMRS